MILVWIKKFLGGRSSAAEAEAAGSLEELVSLVQQGDEELRNRIITDYQPYIAKAASRFSKRYIDPSRDDEFSVALHAFNEAMNHYNADAGRSFLGFAETVIRRRLIDYARKEQRFSSQLPYSAFDIEEEDGESTHNTVEVKQALSEHDARLEQEARSFEILELTEQLGAFGVSFADLAEAAPKHADSRENLLIIGKQLAEREELMRTMLAKSTLPIKELLELTDVSRKTLERNRKYIIAVSLIHYGAYPHLQQYLHTGDGR